MAKVCNCRSVFRKMVCSTGIQCTLVPMGLGGGSIEDDLG